MHGIWLWGELFVLSFVCFWAGFALCAIFRMPELDFSEMLCQVGGTDAEVAIRAWRRGQPTFTLVAQDRLARDIVEQWIDSAIMAEVSGAKIDAAQNVLRRFEGWSGMRKLPD